MGEGALAFEAGFLTPVGEVCKSDDGEDAGGADQGEGPAGRKAGCCPPEAFRFLRFLDSTHFSRMPDKGAQL